MSATATKRACPDEPTASPASAPSNGHSPRCGTAPPVRGGGPPRGPSFEELWINLHPGLMQIFQLESMTRRNYMMLHSQVYSYSTNVADEQEQNVDRQALDRSRHKGRVLYTKLQELIAERLAIVLETFSGDRGDGIYLLQHYLGRWKDFRFSSQVANGICEYLNRVWVKQEQAVEGVDDVFTVFGTCFVQWKNCVYQPLDKSIMRAILDLYAADRNGEVIESQLLHNVIHNFVELGVTADDIGINLDVYKKLFEEPFLEATQAYYVWESATFLQTNSVCDYVMKVHRRLQEEIERTAKYLHESTSQPLTKVLEEALIIHHNHIFDAEFTSLLTRERVEELSIIDNLLSRIPSRTKDLHKLLVTHITTQGGEAISSKADSLLNDPRAFVMLLLELYDRYLRIVNGAFKSDLEYSNAMDRAMETLVNKNAVTEMAKSTQKVPELLARYCDLLLKKSPQNPDDAELDKCLDRVMIVFRYVEDKDVFQKYYTRMLAKRLVHGLSASDDLEGAMISKLRTLCGFEYTIKLQRMFQDVSLSKDLNEEFKHSPDHKRLPEKLEFTLQILSNGAWPFTEKVNLSLSAELERPLTVFTDFYRNKHAQRRLRWLYSVSRCEMTTTCFPMRHILQVSTYQAAVLLLFNEMDAARMEQLATLANVEMALLVQIVIPLVKSKMLLTGEGAGDVEEKDLLPETEVKLNFGFRSKKMRINLNMPMRAEQKQEEEATARNIEEDRKIVIQAALVRVMKMRKTLKHQQLIAEVLTILSTRFKPTIPLVKKCIEILIDKEYMKRDEEDQTQYSYVA
ncbi:cullin-1-like isoform X2 [Paramacrobiotus metropolitanus]|nr:cullin-1-like isoform X2 [Paramacrobiotus metropolitanus]